MRGTHGPGENKNKHNAGDQIILIPVLQLDLIHPALLLHVKSCTKLRYAFAQEYYQSKMALLLGRKVEQ